MDKPIACNSTALSPKQHRQRSDLFHQLEQAAQEIRELEDGYVFHFAAKGNSWMTAATFVDLESQCCPFFTFSLKHHPEGLVQLQMTGPKGVKAFMKSQFDL